MRIIDMVRKRHAGVKIPLSYLIRIVYMVVFNKLMCLALGLRFRNVEFTNK